MVGQKTIIVGLLIVSYLVTLICCHSHDHHHRHHQHDGHHHDNHHHDDQHHDHHHHDDHYHDDHHHNDDHDTKCAGNKYSRECNHPPDEEVHVSEEDEMFKNGHLKPFGSHHPPDEMVEELPYMIAPEDFYMNYVIKHKPVVFKGAVKHWPAYTRWTDEYLNATYGNVSFLMETKNDDKKNVPGDMKLSTFLSSYKQVNRYLVDEVHPEMRKDVVLPLVLRCEEMSSYFFVSYFWMSNGGTSSKIHIDTDENLLSVIHGHKKVILVSPEYSDDLYADDGYLLGVSDIDPQSVDMNKYPRVKNVRYSLANVEEGDIVFIPQMWWHQVVSRSERQQAVAMWWKSKPFWKEQGREASPSDGNKVKNTDTSRKFSFAKVLADYERWVKSVSDRVPRIKCKSQQSFMSDYRFETDKEADAPTTLGDGGDIEEEQTVDEHKLPAADRKTREKEMEADEEIPCDFDRTNPKSPCNYKECDGMDDDNLKCIRYVLDYCKAFDDRGCVIQLPHLLNKLTEEQYKIIRDMASHDLHG